MFTKHYIGIFEDVSKDRRRWNHFCVINFIIFAIANAVPWYMGFLPRKMLIEPLTKTLAFTNVDIFFEIGWMSIVIITSYKHIHKDNFLNVFLMYINMNLFMSFIAKSMAFFLTAITLDRTLNHTTIEIISDFAYFGTLIYLQNKCFNTFLVKEKKDSTPLHLV